jgi:leucine-rich repeat protein SHOC2
LLEHEWLEDGFFDPGRGGVSLPDITRLRDEPLRGEREVILLDDREDAELKRFMQQVKNELKNITDERARVKRLAQLVSMRLGGNELHDLVAASEVDVARIGKLVMPLGELREGVCRHRALLYKYCADRVGLSCRLVRGDYDGGGHAWNEVTLARNHEGGGIVWLCDVMLDPGALYKEGSAEAATHYKRLSERRGGDAGMTSIRTPSVDPKIAHLLRYEVPRGDLEPCTDDAGAVVVLGKGGFGQVIKAKLFGHAGFVAVKRVLPDKILVSGAVEEFKREMISLFDINSTYVVQALGFSSHPDDMFLALEFMPGGSLEDALHKWKDASRTLPDPSWLDWDAAGKRVLKHVAAGLLYMHTRRPPLIHRDIKSGNVLLTAVGDPNVTAKLADFGTMREKMSTFISVHGALTLAYAAPEIFSKRKNIDPKQDEKVDVWAWGVLMWEVLSKKRPPMGYLEPPAKACTASKRLLQRCLIENPGDRPSSAELVHEMGTNLSMGENGGLKPGATRKMAEEVDLEKTSKEDETVPFAPDRQASHNDADVLRTCQAECQVPLRTYDQVNKFVPTIGFDHDDVNVLRTWRAECRELQHIWHEDAAASEWEGVTLGEVGGESEGRVRLIILEDKHLISVPAVIGSFSSLTELHLGGNNLICLPAELGLLAKLTVLFLNENQLTSVPSELGDLTSLTQLFLHGNKLTNLPAKLGLLANLTVLYLHENQLTSVPWELGDLTSLTELHLSGNKLNSLPAGLGLLANLTVLTLNENQLSSVPLELGNLASLTTLHLQRNRLTSLPAELGFLSSLERLYLNENQLTSVPSELGNLTALTTLLLYNNMLASVPLELGNLISLTELILNGNKLTSLPAELGLLAHVTELSFNENQLTSVPSELGNFSSLTDLHLSGNKLTSLPADIGFLTALKKLYLNENRLTSVPPELGNLSSLMLLYLNGNRMISLPAELGLLANLTVLYLHDNQLTSVPSELGNLMSLTHFMLQNNVLTSVPATLGRFVHEHGMHIILDGGVTIDAT